MRLFVKGMTGFGICVVVILSFTAMTVSIDARAGQPIRNGEGDEADSTMCPADNERVRQTLEDFIFPDPKYGYDPIWANKERSGKSGITVPGLALIDGRHEIKVLKDPVDSETCKTLNGLHAGELVKKSTFPDQEEPYYVYDVVYYKAKGYYFAVIAHVPIPQPDDPFLKVLALNHDQIVIYDEKLEEIRSYLR